MLEAAWHEDAAGQLLGLRLFHGYLRGSPAESATAALALSADVTAEMAVQFVAAGAMVHG
ncbi:MAG: hypothetical protein HQ478_11825 [Chloroflexi bacterium]|nr:hypothetical protein [Chloroflexota bacterium]